MKVTFLNATGFHEYTVKELPDESYEYNGYRIYNEANRWHVDGVGSKSTIAEMIEQLAKLNDMLPIVPNRPKPPTTPKKKLKGKG